jgi:imidazolonepropionase-like amidohydrolase
MRAIIAGAIAALLTAGVAAAQDGTTPPAGAVTLVQAGRLLDRPGQAPRGESTVVIRDGQVEAVQDGFVGVEAFPGATVVDLRDRFVLPGLIDSHVHITFVGTVASAAPP